jgi:L-ascorbate metabolism protein UlaG (beta-lactamase superfamily)
MQLPQGLSITYLGHASFKIRTPGGKVVFIDPWLEGNPRCPDAHKKQDRADLILITHGHFDHLSADVAPLARATGATVVAMPEVCAFLSRQGLERFEQMNKGGTIEVMGLRVTMTNAFHSSGAQAEDGSVVYAGDPAGFVLQTEDGFRLYHAGDTCVFGDMKLIGELYAAAGGHAAHRGPVHHGAGGGRARHPAFGGQVRDPHALRHLPPPHGHPGGLEGSHPGH